MNIAYIVSAYKLPAQLVRLVRRLDAPGTSTFISPKPLPHEHWTAGGTDRIDRWHFRAGGRALSFPGSPFSRTWLNRAWSLPAHLLQLRRSFPAGMQPWCGSSYWMMPADCARYVDEFVRERPDYVRFFERVLIPDEIFFHTIVMNSAFAERVAHDDLRYVDWSQDVDHPKLLTTADFERMMASNRLFARKFDPDVDAAVLDLIDRAIAREDEPALST